ncbi:unnamed protein product [Amoebophrya sp. A25]|nr:unnamed protein product [Amoebophrya sp. A25]|eukprot:GSA25T00008777001.1
MTENNGGSVPDIFVTLLNACTIIFPTFLAFAPAVSLLIPAAYRKWRVRRNKRLLKKHLVHLQNESGEVQHRPFAGAEEEASRGLPQKGENGGKEQKIDVAPFVAPFHNGNNIEQDHVASSTTEQNKRSWGTSTSLQWTISTTASTSSLGGIGIGGAPPSSGKVNLTNLLFSENELQGKALSSCQHPQPQQTCMEDGQSITTTTSSSHATSRYQLVLLSSPYSPSNRKRGDLHDGNLPGGDLSSFKNNHEVATNHGKNFFKEDLHSTLTLLDHRDHESLRRMSSTSTSASNLLLEDVELGVLRTPRQEGVLATKSSTSKLTSFTTQKTREDHNQKNEHDQDEEVFTPIDLPPLPVTSQIPCVVVWTLWALLTDNVLYIAICAIVLSAGILNASLYPLVYDRERYRTQLYVLSASSLVTMVLCIIFLRDDTAGSALFAGLLGIPYYTSAVFGMYTGWNEGKPDALGSLTMNFAALSASSSWMLQGYFVANQPEIFVGGLCYAIVNSLAILLNIYLRLRAGVALCWSVDDSRIAIEVVRSPVLVKFVELVCVCRKRTSSTRSIF